MIHFTEAVTHLCSTGTHDVTLFQRGRQTTGVTGWCQQLGVRPSTSSTDQSKGGDFQNCEPALWRNVKKLQFRINNTSDVVIYKDEQKQHFCLYFTKQHYPSPRKHASFHSTLQKQVWKENINCTVYCLIFLPCFQTICMKHWMCICVCVCMHNNKHNRDPIIKENIVLLWCKWLKTPWGTFKLWEIISTHPGARLCTSSSCSSLFKETIPGPKEQSF